MRPSAAPVSGLEALRHTFALAPFAVLIAEQLFASGCRLLLSLTSAGQIVPAGPTPYFVIIDRALRDEGTSYHYAAPSEYGEADARLVAAAEDALSTVSGRNGMPLWTGMTTDTSGVFTAHPPRPLPALRPVWCARSVPGPRTGAGP